MRKPNTGFLNTQSGHREVAATSSGAKSSAGSMFATRTSFSSNKTSPRPKIKIPPVAVVAWIIGSVMRPSRSPAESVSVPCTTKTVPADKMTPHPKTDANDSEAIKSSALLRASKL